MLRKVVPCYSHLGGAAMLDTKWHRETKIQRPTCTHQLVWGKARESRA